MNSHKILVVDDDPLLVKIVSANLRAGGFTVSTAADGGSALGMIRDTKPDLVLLDVNFPPDVANGGGVAWNGILLMNWMRQMSDLRVPVVIMTAREDSEIESKAMAAGAVGFLRKPFRSEVLLSFIRKTLATPA